MTDSQTFDQQALDRAMGKVREAAEKYGPLGRPADSFCICQQWVCPCPCHKSHKKAVGDPQGTPDAPPGSDVIDRTP